MTYDAEITWYAKGDEGDTTFEQSFDTEDAAIAWLGHNSLGRSACRMWINNVEVNQHGVPKYVDCIVQAMKPSYTDVIAVAAFNAEMKAIAGDSSDVLGGLFNDFNRIFSGK